MSPQDLIAKHYMDHKGYAGVEPYDVDKLDGEPCWYYLYELEDGSHLELEVFWDGGQWETTVTSFELAK